MTAIGTPLLGGSRSRCYRPTGSVWPASQTRLRPTRSPLDGQAGATSRQRQGDRHHRRRPRHRPLDRCRARPRGRRRWPSATSTLELTEQVAGEIGGETVGLPLDVTERESFAAFLDGVEDRLGPVDVLINNAGIMPLGDFAEEDDATTIRTIDINVHGVLTGTKLAVRRMRPRRTGHIVNVASMVGKIAPPGGATYWPASTPSSASPRRCSWRTPTTGSSSRSSCRSSCAPSSAPGSRRPAA